ncbi:Stk1 family PASTA domain-containing Ser/Thr kinase [Cellulomonas sp. PSBB021]|uniref:Stk1 family PASTA domain-containing Ser/Thr kinase n=1 Tax=Cellulomonas sp. PSBB021 TaxID=2003551 RepID=UPI000AC54777|nr:Stk1 family PASTA domain-containing Ser/Thr kinase [Cellulomonas sp. PSBB021]ASR55972.1 serine/threonine protein kinase [Cellulomonas sp. PSBB021]
MVDSGPRLLAGRYEVGELIGRGGMAEVHIGHDTRLGRTVAIKILRSDLARDPSFQNRFRREAQAAAALNHPAIVAVYDTGEDIVTEPTGVVAHVPFIVMEYVEGHTVRDILRDGSAVPIEEAVEITIGVLSALEYSHHAGIVHRDIKPANVMLTPTGAVKVMDFGIARAVADSAATMTATQAVIGTAQYLSPEQARGEQVDARSDLYSTGCLLFELLTGRPPFTGDSLVSVAYQHVREAAPVPSSFASDVPESLDRITMKALTKDRDARYSNAAEFRADLEAVLRGGVVSAPPVGMAAVSAVPATDATQVMSPTATTIAPTQAFPPATPWGSTGIGNDLAAAGSDEDDDENKRPWLIWVLVGIAVLAVAGIVALLVANSGSDDPKTVAVPTVVGLTEDEAVAALQAADLVPGQRTQEGSTTVPAGQVISSNPAEGTEVELESVVDYVVSSGPDSVEVEDVSGRTESQAEQVLEGQGLTVNGDRKEDNNPSFPKGQVTKTDPPAGEQVKAGSSVTLYVSTGNVDLPDLVGMSEKDALAKLAELKLVATVNKVTTTEHEAGKVFEQDRPAGLVPQGTQVTIQVAVAPETARIPDNINDMTFSEATQALGALGFSNIRREEQASDEERDSVLWTEPGPGTELQLDDLIVIYVSSGPPEQTQQPDPGDTQSPGPGNGGGNSRGSKDG